MENHSPSAGIIQIRLGVNSVCAVLSAWLPKLPRIIFDWRKASDTATVVSIEPPAPAVTIPILRDSAQTRHPTLEPQVNGIH
jgi:hypothetical protein